MTALTCMRGYPGSGKSTIAHSLAVEYPAVVVNRDLLRKMAYDSWYGGRIDEDTISTLERAAVVALLEQGQNVIIDAMHVDPRYLYAWAKLAARYGAGWEVVDVLTDAKTCIQRDWERGFNQERHVGRDVIERIAKRWPIDKWPVVKPYGPKVEPYIPPAIYAPNAIIVDIDGTLAHNNAGRSPYDYTRVLEDDIDPDVRQLMEFHHERGDRVIICSGRDDSCRDDTLTWLYNHNVWWDKLHMRATVKGPKDPDWVIKLAIFNEHIRHKYNVKFVLDDRAQVVQLWRRLGLKCWQVQEGNF